MTSLLLTLMFGTGCHDTQTTPNPNQDAGQHNSPDLSTTEDATPSDFAEEPPDLRDRDTEQADQGAEPTDLTPEDITADTTTDMAQPEDPCQEVDSFRPFYDDLIGRWTQQDARSPHPEGSLLLVGSSSARRWEDFARHYSAYAPLQRGFGGSQLGEVALRAQDLIIAHRPAAVMVFAGTNDVAFGVNPPIVVQRFACLVQRIRDGLGDQTPILFLGITPTPSRWSRWERSQAVNQAIQTIAQDDPTLHYVDIPSAFLATGSPPAQNLFVDDRLHLSPEGYDLWQSVLKPVVESILTPQDTVEPGTQTLTPGTRLLVDLGPDDNVHGESSPSPDYLGQHWNNWPSVAGYQEVLPGEHLAQLRDDLGNTTQVGMMLTGGFQASGWLNGGHRWPSEQDLGNLAVGSATGDFFYTSPPDRSGGFLLSGLDPGQDYTLQFFASRQDPQRRVTRYQVHGAQTQSVDLQASGEGASPEGTKNLSTIATLDQLRPDAWGRLFVDIQIVEGDFAYLSMFSLQAR